MPVLIVDEEVSGYGINSSRLRLNWRKTGFGLTFFDFGS